MSKVQQLLEQLKSEIRAELMRDLATYFGDRRSSPRTKNQTTKRQAKTCIVKGCPNKFNPWKKGFCAEHAALPASKQAAILKSYYAEAKAQGKRIRRKG